MLGILHWGFGKTSERIWSTYRSWLVMAPIGMAVVFAGRVPTIVGVTLLASSVSRNLRALPALYRDWWMTGAVYAGILAVGDRLVHTASAGRRTRHGLVRILCRGSGFCDRADFARPDFA